MQHLTQALTRDFPTPPPAVYAAILNQTLIATDRSAIGAVLSITPVWGAPGAIGYQSVFRCNWGLVDLEMTEIILAATPPAMLRVSQRPQRLLRHDPAERLPPLGHEPPLDLEKTFAKAFGASPPTTEIQFDLTPIATGTSLRLSIDARMLDKPGWLQRRRWHRQAPAQANLVFARIAAALG